MKAIILAAGYGVRMYPLTENTAKPLLPISGKPLLYYILNKVIEARPEEIIIVTNAKFYEDFVKFKKNFPCTIPITLINDLSTSNENRLGAIKDLLFACESLPEKEELLVLAADNLLEFNLKDFCTAGKKFGGEATITVRSVLSKEILRRHGVAELSGNRVISLEEKPQEPKSTLISICCYYFPSKLKLLLQNYLAENKGADAPGNFISWLAKRGSVSAFVFKEKVFDIGCMEDYNKIKDSYSMKNC